MKLLERVYFGIVRKPIKTLIVFIVMLIVVNLMTASLLIYNSTQVVVDEINDVVEPIVMIERPITRSDTHINFSQFNLERDENEARFNELEKVYDVIISMPEIEYSDIAISALLYLEEMRNIKPLNYDYAYTNTNRYNFNCFAVMNANSYYFENEYFKIIEGRNLTQEEVNNGEYKIVVHRSVNVEKNGKQHLAEVGDKITLGTRILKENLLDTKFAMDYDYSEAATPIYNQEYLKILVENPTIEFEIVGIFEEVLPTNLLERPKGIIPYQTYKHIVNSYNNRVNELEENKSIKKYDKSKTYQFNNMVLSNAYSVFELKNEDDIGNFKNKVYEIMNDKKFYDAEISYANDVYLKVVGPLESLNSVSSFILIFGIVVGIILLGLITLIFIRERKHEIGILLTLGESKKRIIRQLMMEILFIGLLAMFTTTFTTKYIINSIQENVLSNYKESVQLNENEEIMLGNMSIKEISNKYEDLLETSDSILIATTSTGTMMLVCYASLFVVFKMNPKDILM